MANLVPLSAQEILDREFLEVRARLLQIAATLDRMERAEGDVENDPRMQKIAEALDALTEHGATRAEKIQLIFSRPYDERWRDEFALRS